MPKAQMDCTDTFFVENRMNSKDAEDNMAKCSMLSYEMVGAAKVKDIAPANTIIG